MNDISIHRTALVETKEIGTGTRIWAFSHIMRGARVGKDCNIGDHCFIESGVVIGDNCTIKNGNMLWEGITLEEGVFVGPHVFFTNDLHPRSPRLPEARARYRVKENWLQPTIIMHGASLGSGAIILAGVTVGAYAMIAAGSVVTKTVCDYGLVKGSPARFAGWVCQCGLTLRLRANAAICEGCGRRFELLEERLRVADAC